MNALTLFAAAGLVSWLLRVSFVTLLPAQRLPRRIRGALASAGPAAMASMLAAELGRSASGGDLAVTVAAGTAVYAICSLAA